MDGSPGSLLEPQRHGTRTKGSVRGLELVNCGSSLGRFADACFVGRDFQRSLGAAQGAPSRKVRRSRGLLLFERHSQRSGRFQLLGFLQALRRFFRGHVDSPYLARSLEAVPREVIGWRPCRCQPFDSASKHLKWPWFAVRRPAWQPPNFRADETS